MDINFPLGGHVINLRVGAIVRRGTGLLVGFPAGEPICYLPGGRIRAGESSLDAIGRELREEVGNGFEVQRLSVCAENFFTYRGTSVHEVCFYYEVLWTGGELRPEGPSEEEIRWIAVSEVPALNLVPGFLKARIANPPATTAVLIHRDPPRS